MWEDLRDDVVGILGRAARLVQLPPCDDNALYLLRLAHLAPDTSLLSHVPQVCMHCWICVHTCMHVYDVIYACILHYKYLCDVAIH